MSSLYCIARGRSAALERQGEEERAVADERLRAIAHVPARRLVQTAEMSTITSRRVVGAPGRWRHARRATG